MNFVTQSLVFSVMQQTQWISICMEILEINIIILLNWMRALRYQFYWVIQPILDLQKKTTLVPGNECADVRYRSITVKKNIFGTLNHITITRRLYCKLYPHLDFLPPQNLSTRGLVLENTSSAYKTRERGMTNNQENHYIEFCRRKLINLQKSQSVSDQERSSFRITQKIRNF